jgi:glutamate formiminotransferase/formiminotetrahydrofolate cyclodeaminase
MRGADACWDPMLELARHINFASRSDLEVGARCVEVGAWGACRNVLVNLEPVTDEAFRKSARTEAEALATRARERCAEVLAALEARKA